MRLIYKGTFLFSASRSEMWDAISSIQSFERWAPWLRGLSVEGEWLEPGSTVSFGVVSPLPLRLQITVETVHVVHQELIEARVSNDLDGTGSMRASDSGTGTAVELTWDVIPRSRALRALLRVSGPFVRWTQDWAVKAAVAGVRRKL